MKKQYFVNKSTGYDLITGRATEKLLNNGIAFLNLILNAILRSWHLPAQGKVEKNYSNTKTW